MKPGHSLYVYRELSRLSVEQANSLLQNVIDKKLRLQDLRSAAKEQPDPPPEEELAVQRIRKVKT